MLKLTFNAKASTTQDLIVAIEELNRLVENGFTQALWMSNGEGGGFSFSIEGEESETATEPEEK